MFSRVASLSRACFIKQASKLSHSASSLGRFAGQSSRSYSTGAASCNSHVQ